MTTWPTTFPCALLSNYNETIPDTTIRSEMDQGPAKVRRITSAGVPMISFSMILTGALLSDLETFYLDTCASGSLPFTMDHPRTGDSITVRFRSPPQFSPLGGGKFSAGVSLEVIP